MNSETKNCQNCKKDFTVEEDDFSFYEKMKVPPPTFCPDCRLQRRLAWMIGTRLFKRECGLCKQNVISMYEPTAPLVVYCHKCWWSDKWDPSDYATEVDFSKPFLLQWKELLDKTPILGLSVDSITGDFSPFTNHTGNSKSCYMTYYSANNEYTSYGFYLVGNKNVLNSSMSINSELGFDNKNSFKNYNAVGFEDSIESMDSAFLKDCINCSNCFGSANLRNAKYVFFNEQLSKEQYNEKLDNIDLGSHDQYKYWKDKTTEHFKSFPPKPEFADRNANSTGSYFFDSKNCQEGYEVVGIEDSKYIMLVGEPPVRDAYDYVHWGSNTSLAYECVTVGDGASEVKFISESGHNIRNIEYSKLSTGAAYHFGCVSMKKKNYCILNKQYSKEEYTILREKIIKHMEDVPYVDKTGKVYKYGEFFPMEFALHSYNNSFANFFFPKTKDESLVEGLKWYEEDPKEYPITMPASNLSDNIKDTTNEILKEVIGCSLCPKGYKITEQELDLSRRLNVPLARACPFCRIDEKIKKWVKQMRQLQRECDKCGSIFKTHYDKSQAPKIFCKKCYQQEVY